MILCVDALLDTKPHESTRVSVHRLTALCMLRTSVSIHVLKEVYIVLPVIILLLSNCHIRHDSPWSGRM